MKRVQAAGLTVDEAVRRFLAAGDLTMTRTNFGRPLFDSIEEAARVWPVPSARLGGNTTDVRAARRAFV